MNTSLFERNGGTYSTVSDYRIPNLALQDESEYSIGLWGQRRLDYLKNHRRVLYVNLLTSGKLTEHLREVDKTAFEQRERIVKQMMEAQGVTEQLKGESQLLWVGKVNNICACADEIIRNELIYD
ncbi:MAG: TnpV protein [Oscillospiraceae bacterium]|nr:TnpV protein [Oscillospiraceae bacterium]